VAAYHKLKETGGKSNFPATKSLHITGYKQENKAGWELWKLIILLLYFDPSMPRNMEKIEGSCDFEGIDQRPERAWFIHWQGVLALIRRDIRKVSTIVVENSAAFTSTISLHPVHKHLKPNLFGEWRTINVAFGIMYPLNYLTEEGCHCSSCTREFGRSWGNDPSAYTSTSRQSSAALMLVFNGKSRASNSLLCQNSSKVGCVLEFPVNRGVDRGFEAPL